MVPNLFTKLLMIDPFHNLGNTLGLTQKTIKASILPKICNYKLYFFRYQSGQQAEADESTALIFLEKSRIESWDIPDSLATRLTHHALGGLRLYHLYMKL